MQVWTGLDQVPGDLGDSAVTIGNFDGVHTGHRQVLQRVVEEAARRSVSPVAVTFHPHPLAVLHPGRAPEIITGRRTRRHLLAGTGLAGLLELEFTPELARHSPRQFVEETFVKAFGAAAVVVGHDVRFGHRNSGDIDMLRVLGSEYGFDVMTMEDVNGTVHGRHADRRWSSSWVR
ncbi:MAG: bifunctional riboflavin kinase/FMN adenylyltransferase, partial [Micrococcales bacterium]